MLHLHEVVMNGMGIGIRKNLYGPELINRARLRIPLTMPFDFDSLRERSARKT
jgi:hypothetical protein